MNHSNLIFNKDLYTLDFNDLTAFFTTTQTETLNLEFKSYVAQGPYQDKENTIKKAVCGLLNSEGGIIIWGAPTEVRNGQGYNTAIGALTPFTSALDRDRLINILTSSITPMPVGIRVQFIRNAANDTAIVIEVQKSLERPHQYDNRYYVRLDGQTRIAPHYLISALMKSTDFPILRGHLRLKRIDTNATHILLHFRKLLVNASVYNNEKNINMRLVGSPGEIWVNETNEGSSFSNTYPILSHGAPLMSNFILSIPRANSQDEIRIFFQFIGERSPSKISNYKYRLPQPLTIGAVQNEAHYLVEKSENKLPSDISNNTIEENIEIFLNS